MTQIFNLAARSRLASIRCVSIGLLRIFCDFSFDVLGLLDVLMLCQVWSLPATPYHRHLKEWARSRGSETLVEKRLVDLILSDLAKLHKLEFKYLSKMRCWIIMRTAGTETRMPWALLLFLDQAVWVFLPVAPEASWKRKIEHHQWSHITPARLGFWVSEQCMGGALIICSIARATLRNESY